MQQTIGNRIMQNRKRLKLTQDQLAEKLGVTAQAVSKWENDQSCPDISVLPRLADIFGISTDQLLGRETKENVCLGEAVPEDSGDGKHHLQLSLHSGKKYALGLAVLVICVGGMYLLASLLRWDISLWRIGWSASLLVFGLFGLYPRFSFLHLSCVLAGGYFLISPLLPASANLSGSVIVAAVILLFGISMLFDAMRREKKPMFSLTYDGNNTNNYHTDGQSFQYSSSFGSNRQPVELESLQKGEISTSFGEYTVDMTGVQSLAEHAFLEADCSFGELTILVPRKFAVRPDSSTAFAAFNVEGTPVPNPEGELLLQASVNFGELRVRYL